MILYKKPLINLYIIDIKGFVCRCVSLFSVGITNQRFSLLSFLLWFPSDGLWNPSVRTDCPLTWILESTLSDFCLLVILGESAF